MIRLIKIFGIVLFSLSCLAQNATDLDQSFMTARNMARTNPDSALILADYLDSVLTAIHKNHLKYKVEMLRGDVYLIKKENGSALESYEKMSDHGETDTIVQLKALRISRYFRNLGDYPSALNYALLNLQYAEEMEDDFKLSAAHGNLSSIYYRLDQRGKALSHEKKRISISKKAAYTKGEFLGYYNSSQYIDNTKVKEKLRLLTIADSINENHLKNKYFSQSINLNIGELFKQENRNQEALVALEKVKEQCLNTKNAKTKFYFLQVYAQVLNQLKRHSEAKAYIDQGLEAAKEYQSLEYEEIFLFELEHTYLKQGDYKNAYLSREKWSILKDSLRDESVLKEVEELSAKYESAAKDIQLANSNLEITRKTNQRNIAIAFLSFICLLTLYIWRRNRYKQELAQQNLELKNKKLETLEKEKQLLSLTAMIDGQEEERKRIALDLHDGLGGLLSAAKTHISVIQDEIKKIESLNIYHKASNMIDEAVVEVRRISQNMMPSSLRLKGLSEAISDLCQDLEQVDKTTFHYEYKNNENKILDDKIALSLYRIVQEACNNIIRHAEANEVYIQLSIFGNELSLMIEDDGKGFDANTTYQGIGLQSFTARIDQMKGVLDIDSKTGEGTTITINIPLGGVKDWRD